MIRFLRKTFNSFRRAHAMLTAPSRPLARGYLREDALAEAMAYYARLRGERHPAWRKRLDRPVRVVV